MFSRELRPSYSYGLYKGFIVSKSAYIRVRIEPELKMQAEAIFKEFGVTPTQVITMLYKQVLRNHEIPQEIARAIEEARKE
jgi:DNA-damage-inducible protein J